MYRLLTCAKAGLLVVELRACWELGLPDPASSVAAAPAAAGRPEAVRMYLLSTAAVAAVQGLLEEVRRYLLLLKEGLRGWGSVLPVVLAEGLLVAEDWRCLAVVGEWRHLKSGAARTKDKIGICCQLRLLRVCWWLRTGGAWQWEGSGDT